MRIQSRAVIRCFVVIWSDTGRCRYEHSRWQQPAWTTKLISGLLVGASAGSVGVYLCWYPLLYHKVSELTTEDIH